jgi:choline dehydrogenase-like flavoprotein
VSSDALDTLPPEAFDPATTPFDYIVVGSGPGGAPLACRLARAGMRVLVLEAGTDPGAATAPDADPTVRRAAENARSVYHCPGLHAVATEPHEHGLEPDACTSWSFDVDHDTDPAAPPVLYPRASALGGCTAHHAMISIYGLDSDWRKIADLTNDESWAPGRMRAIFQRIERTRERQARSWIGRWLRRLLAWLLAWFRPEGEALAGRGRDGWLDVTMPDPALVVDDGPLLRRVAKAVIEAEHVDTLPRLLHLAKRFLRGRLSRDFDLNDEQTMRESPEGVTLVPLAVSRDGVRRGPRELLLETREELRRRRHDDALTGDLRIVTGVFVRRVLFDRSEPGSAPRAVGVELQHGTRLYEASRPRACDLAGEPRRCFARREILVCAGAFNSPQLLMLSGIGDAEHLHASGVEGLTDQTGATQKGLYVHLPGVGGNLCDRCEISVISEMAEDFRTLDGVEFRPGSTSDVALQAWLATGSTSSTGATGARSGLYTTNGAVLAIVKRSTPEVIEPDLFVLGFPVAFRGYFEGWSHTLLRKDRDVEGSRSQRLWSWVILKAYSKNRGTVRLRSNDPLAAPAIHFRFFGDRGSSPSDGARAAERNEERNDDLEALVRGVAYVRALNRGAAPHMSGRDAARAELQPGAANADGSDELRAWIVREAWGHHAAGTCAIGADPWQAWPERLKQAHAVLDGKFRVHGVRGLRVVDASVFPALPGYFPVTSIYMVSEKAADTILDELPV